jgi:hypothetical protein
MTIIALYGLATFAALFGAGILGLLAGKPMPEKYHDYSTRAIVQTATGMVSLLAALVLGLLVATAKNKSLTRKFPGVGERPVIHRLRDGSEALIRDVDTSA